MAIQRDPDADYSGTSSGYANVPGQHGGNPNGGGAFGGGESGPKKGNRLGGMNGFGQAGDTNDGGLPPEPSPVVGSGIQSPFVSSPVTSNFFNLGRHFGGSAFGGMQPRQDPTAVLLRMLEQMRMQKMNDLHYAPYLSAFRRF
ncbi:hypothetical protein [Caudoviricetes sp.]|nr:hypothetical protein [Caudoviricetes sp.]